MILRPYQEQNRNAVYDSWKAGARNVLSVLPTGAGKTVIVSDIIRDHVGPSCSIAHRQELVSQISIALARNEVIHRIIGPQNVVRNIVQLHMMELGKSFYHPTAECAVAGVDTLVRRGAQLRDWLPTVGLIVQDEAHHVTKKNKWGTAAGMFHNARMLGVTATPLRADGQGLGTHADGLFDDMVVGPNLRDLINMRYLTDYRVFAPPSDLDLHDVDVSKATGDFNPNKLKKAVRRSHIMGDVVTHYLRITPGALGVTFCTDVETATETADRFNAAGVPSAVVSAKTPDMERAAILRKFRNREILMITNVDLFGEGTDIPALEVVCFCRPTQSYGLYVQAFGRALRLMDGKDRAVIIDHVGNVARHGLPDMGREWTLDRRDKRAKQDKDDIIPVRTCGEPTCLSVYERTSWACPYCGWEPKPVRRDSPEMVDGDLAELTPEILAAMRGDIATVDGPVILNSQQPEIGQLAHRKRHRLRQEAQVKLRETMAYWAGKQLAMGRQHPENHKRFYFKFGHDVLSAQTLGVKEAEALQLRIEEDM
jgi:DNA repair protein RadD